jgi:asparagine synthase (glutamine-hydrolysing)
VAKLGGNITAFTVGTPGDPWDETIDAKRTARELGIAHEVRDLDPTQDPNVSDLISAYGEPFACASALGMLKISQAVTRNATVLLTGDGGDDVFLGYPEHRHLRAAEIVARVIPGGAWWRTLRRGIPRVGLLRRAVTFGDFVTGGLAGVVAAHDGLPFFHERGLLGERLSDARVDHADVMRSRRSAKQVLSDFLEYDRRGRFVGEYMTKVDGATMYHGLEARSPFLDQDLWEFASSLPFGIRLQGGRLKAVLRELARQKIGARVSTGRKRGFGIPVQRWMAGRWRTFVVDTFRDSLLHREGWINEDALRREMEAVKPEGCVPKQLWYAYVLEKWLEHESQHSPAKEPSTYRVFA